MSRQGRELVREGDFSYEFMVIEEGEAEVTRDGKHVNDLGSGDFFGEMGLLEKTLRNATVTAKTPMRLDHAHRLGPEAHGAPHPRGDRAGPRHARRAPPELSADGRRGSSCSAPPATPAA